MSDPVLRITITDSTGKVLSASKDIRVPEGLPLKMAGMIAMHIGGLFLKGHITEALKAQGFK